MRHPRFISAIFLAALLAAGATAALAQVQEERVLGSAGITVFADRSFRGDAAIYRTDVPDLRASDMNNRITSVRVAPGEEWELCERPDYGGRCVVVSGEEADLSKYGWSDTISSMRRVRGGHPPEGGPYPPGGGEPPRDHGFLVLFDRTDYRGSNASYGESASSLGRFSRRAESVNVERGAWELCDGASFTGRCVTVDHSLPDLGVYGLRNRVASVRPVRDTGPAGGLRPPRSDWSIVLYDRTNYRGTPINYARDEPYVGSFGSRAMSIAIRGSWELCEGPRYTGRCVTVEASAPDLETYGLRHHVGSLRPTRYTGTGGERPGGGDGWSIVLFDEPGYRGRPLNYDGPAPRLGAFSERVSSVTIRRGVWELCDEPDYSGRCVTLNASVPDLALYGMRRGVASVRPVRREPR